MTPRTSFVYGAETDDEPLPASGYRTYEVFQRERVGESTNLLSPAELIGDEMLTGPHRLLKILREHYPCYRDWKSNTFWITRYDDVTSILADDANFGTRPDRWRLGLDGRGQEHRRGRNLWDHVAILSAHEQRIDGAVETIVESILDELDTASGAGPIDLATDFAGRLSIELWGAVLDLDADDLAVFAQRLWRMRLGLSWNQRARLDGQKAFDELVRSVEPLLDERRLAPGDDLISIATRLDLDGGGDGGHGGATATDIVTTLLEADHHTLHGGLANMWMLLLTHPEQLGVVRDDPRLMKFAWLETLRHSPPDHSTTRFARHEVERFGRLLPDGALLHVSAAAANRDPRVFDDPDRFVVGRSDLCQREPRGQYRADGLASGVAVGLGRPTVHPAVPKDRPRSMYAITRDVAVTASRMLLERFGDITLVDGSEPHIRALSLGEMYTCWSLQASVHP